MIMTTLPISYEKVGVRYYQLRHDVYRLQIYGYTHPVLFGHWLFLAQVTPCTDIEA